MASDRMTGLQWRKPCESASCLLVAFTGDEALVRDSKVDDGPVLWFTRDEWQAHVDAVKRGELEWPEQS